MRRHTLSRRVTLFTTLGFGGVWVVSVLLISLVLWSEQEELFDQQLADTAQIMLPLLSQSELQGTDQATLRAPQPRPDPDEALVFRLLDRDGKVLRQSDLADTAHLPDPVRAQPDGFGLNTGYRSYMTEFNAAGHAMQLSAPMAERREAFREGLTGFLLPMLALLPLTWLLIGWLSRRALVPMHDLGAQIARRDGHRLQMIDASAWPTDVAQIATTLNGFMARLAKALDAERAFATNAAHELRTPVAIALAQTQQLRANTDTTAQITRIDAVERALQRMKRLVARLLQLARADAGLGISAQGHDLGPLTRLVLGDVVPQAALARVTLDLPPTPVPARIDPDAFAIVLGNLLENALQHGPADGQITVTLGPGAVEVTNGGPVVPELAALPQRFNRHGQAGFGLGLHICSQILEQAGGRLELLSPAPCRTDGFMARAVMPLPK